MDSAVRKVYEAATHKVYCEECGWHGTFNQVDQVQDPRGDDIWSVCPECRMPEDIRTTCDELGCLQPGTCGTPTPERYRWTCFKHRPVNELPSENR